MNVDLIWVDIETTGLEAGVDKILEVGVILTDRFGEHIAGDSWLVGELDYGPAIAAGKDNEFVGPMHDKNGLWSEWHRDFGTGNPRMRADARQQDILEFIKKWGGKQGVHPMAGATIHFDRKMLAVQMPELERFFHYRNFDISTIKQAARWLNPTCAEVDPTAADGLVLHRGYDDCIYEIEEYKHYIDNFFFVPEPAVEG